MKCERNDPCPCGSGKKYKKCCGLKEAVKDQERVGGMRFPGAMMGYKNLSESVIKVIKGGIMPSFSELSAGAVTEQKSQSFGTEFPEENPDDLLIPPVEEKSPNSL